MVMEMKDRKKRRNNQNRLVVLLLLTAVLALMVTGCKKKKEPEPVVPPPVAEEPEPEPKPEVTLPPVEDTHPDEIRSQLTNLWIPKEYENKRPFAVMLNNIKNAYPQSGTEEAGIIYEILAEGGITRLMGLFDYVSADRLGSVRSARHYYVSFAYEYDSVYVHFGQTDWAKDKWTALGQDHLSGLSGEGSVVFYRDNSIKAPHNAFTSKDGLEAGMEYKKFRTDHEEGFAQHFQFASEELIVNHGSADAVEAAKIKLGFSSYANPYFEYHDEDKLYYRFAYDTEHIDKNTGNQLTFTNLLIQFVNEWALDKNNYQTMELDNSNGKGYYVTQGKAVPIYWKKGEAKEITRYYYDEAFTQEIKLNTGKTYIAVFPENRTGSVVFEGGQAAAAD